MHELQIGKSIAITRPVGSGEGTSRFVRKLGWTPFIVNTVELRPVEASSIFQKFSELIRKGPIDWLVFMSPTGVDAFFDMLKSHQSVLSSALGRVRIVAVGPRTGSALKHRGVKEVFVPEEFSSIGVLDYLSTFEKGRRVVLLRSSAADERLAKSLVSQGALVESLILYESVVPTETESVQEFLAALERGLIQAILFTSAVSASNLFAMAEPRVGSSRLIRLLRARLVGAIGPVTAERLRGLGIDPSVPGRHLIEDAIEELVDKYEDRLVAETRAIS